VQTFLFIIEGHRRQCNTRTLQAAYPWLQTQTYCFSAPKIVKRTRLLLRYTHIPCLVHITIFCLRRL